MKGLTDLTPLLTATALTELVLADMAHLDPSAVTVLRTHPTLQRLSVGLGSNRKNNAVTRQLPLLPAGFLHGHPTLDPRSA
jgi:hypothetical protein